VGRTVKVYILQAMFIVSDHVVNAVDSWIEDVSIQSEAVRGFLAIRRDSSTEAV
jgi:hypothetical protein